MIVGCDNATIYGEGVQLHTSYSPSVATKTTVADALALVQPLLPSELMAPNCLSHAHKVASLLPLDAVSFFGFETRLAEGQNLSTDCALNLSASGAELMTSGNVGHGSDAWKKVTDFYRLWAQTHSDPFADASATWLEFDSNPQQPEPNLMFGYWPNEEKCDRPWQWMQDKLFPALFLGDYSEPLKKAVQTCYDALPASVGDFQFGLMLARPIQAIRLCIFDLPTEEMIPYLRRIGWQGDFKSLEKYLEAFAPYADFIGLHLDIAGPVLPHIGIEPNFKSGSWSRQPHREPRWHGLFDQLKRFDLMCDAKHKALLDWGGHQQVQYGATAGLLLRGLSHTKVVLAPDGSAIAKAYFGIAHRDSEGSST